MTSALIFVETSIHVHRFLANLPEQEQLEAQLAALAPNLYTSHYVWMEFQRSLMADFAHIQQLMQTQTSWGQVLTHLLERQRAFQPRSAVRCTQIIGLLFDQCEGDWEYARQIAQYALASTLKSRFWTHIKPLPDLILCDLVTKGIARQPDGSYKVADHCRKEEATCHLPDFLSEQKTKLRAIADYLTAHPHSIKQQERVERLLADILIDPRAALGQFSCWPLGDVIIALQTPSHASIWTRDPDFKPLALALGIDLYKN